jgi:hypothetical protein
MRAQPVRAREAHFALFFFSFPLFGRRSSALIFSGRFRERPRKGDGRFAHNSSRACVPSSASSGAIVLLHLARTDFFSRGSTMGINMTWSVPCGGCQETLTKASNPKKCGKCHSVWYCSKECQTLDWKRPNKQGHKHLCAALAAANKTEGAGRPRSEKALNKPEMEDTRGLLDRFNEILTTQVLPGTQTYAMMSKMLEDGVAKGARAMLIIHEQVLGNGKISFSIVPEDKVEVLLKNDAGFSRHALMVRTYDPKTQFVICFETGSPEKFIVTRLVAEDVIDPRRGRHRPGGSS